MAWRGFQEGSSLGDRGSEGGIILLDEEHVEGARITLEQGGAIAPFSITCGVYGWMCHTRFFATRAEAEAEYERMKEGLATVLNTIPFQSDPDYEERMRSAADAVGRFVEAFP